MKTKILLIFSLLFYTNLSAQNTKIVYVEWFGPGSLLSANYDMRFTKKQSGPGGRIGFGMGVAGAFGKGSQTIPLGLNYLLGNDGRKYFEIGLGYTYVKFEGRDKEETSVFKTSFGNLTFGYRFAPAKGGFLFKAQITPLFNQYSFVPYYGGIGVGYKF